MGSFTLWVNITLFQHNDDRQEVSIFGVSHKEEQTIFGEGAEWNTDSCCLVWSEAALWEHDVAIAIEAVTLRNKGFKHASGEKSYDIVKCDLIN